MTDLINLHRNKP